METQHLKRRTLKLHSSIHDDEPCLCLDCTTLRQEIERNAHAQPRPLPTRRPVARLRG